MARVYVGIGSNLRPRHNLQFAVRELRRTYGEVTLSPVYRNAPVGFSGADFLNMVAAFDTTHTPGELNDYFEQLHERAGRVREGERVASRTLDIDLLLWSDKISDDPPLPREDILVYDFVLRPLVDIAPDTRHPVTGRTFAEHLAEMNCGGHTLERIALAFDRDGPDYS